MAQCVVEGDHLTVHLSTTERLESVHSDVRVALSTVRGVDVVENLLDYVHGVRVGTGIPGATAVGTFTSKTARLFAVVHHGAHRGVRIRLEGAEYDELLVGCDDAETVAATIPVAPPDSP